MRPGEADSEVREAGSDGISERERTSRAARPPAYRAPCTIIFAATALSAAIPLAMSAGIRSMAVEQRSRSEFQMEEKPPCPVLALEGPYKLAERGQNHRSGGEASSSVHRQLREHRLLGVVVEQDLALSKGRSEGL